MHGENRRLYILQTPTYFVLTVITVLDEKIKLNTSETFDKCSIRVFVLTVLTFLYKRIYNIYIV